MVTTAVSVNALRDDVQTERFYQLYKSLCYIGFEAALDHLERYGRDPAYNRNNDTTLPVFYKIDKVLEILSEKLADIRVEQRMLKKGDMTKEEIEAIFFSAVNESASPAGQTNHYLNAQLITAMERFGDKRKRSMPNSVQQLDEVMEFMHEQAEKAWALMPKLRQNGFYCGREE